MAYPQFEAPEWQTQRISALRQKFAAPQVGRLKRQMGGMMGMGYDPQSVQARRETIRGYGEGLGGIMGAAGQSALSQYGQEYGTQMRGAELGFGAEMEEERSRLAGVEAERGREWQTAERRKLRDWEFGMTKYKLTGEQPGGPTPATAGIRRRAKGGPVYAVGEGGSPSKPKPELVVYKGGRMELVGKKGPEIRTFAQSGQVIPAGKTKKILKRQYGGWVHGPEQEALRQRVESKKYRDILSGGAKKAPTKSSAMQDTMMNFLTSTRMDPSGGAGHMPWWQFMLQRQPEKLTGLLTYLGGGKPSFGKAGGAGPARIQPTRKGFVSERQGVSKSPSGPGTEGPGAYAELRGFKEPSPKYKRWLGRG